MDSDKQLKKLEGILSILETDRASEDEVAMAFEAVLGVIKQLKDQIDQDIKNNKGEMDDLFTGVVAELKKLENRITKSSDRLEEKMGVDNKQLKEQLLQEVNSVRDLIPTIPSFEPLEKKIEEVRGLIPKIPKELTADQLVDKINTLEEVIELDTIKGLKAKLSDLEKKWTSRPMFGGGYSKIAADSHDVPNEVVAGSGTSWTLSHIPSPSNSLKLYALGVRLPLTIKYTISGASITTVDSYSTGELLADFKI